MKTVKLGLSKFPAIPPSLVDPKSLSTSPKPLKEIPVNLDDLYAHYYMHSYDRAVPGPAALHFEQIHHLTTATRLTFKKNGLGAHKSKKINNSNDLGEAFCRWFLSTHLAIYYFGRMDDVCGHGAIAHAGGASVERSTKGDAPDYFCADRAGGVFLAEAKGTVNSLTLRNEKFKTWRNQFSRVTVRNRMGVALAVKGYIIASRYAVEPVKRTYSWLLAEDPASPGNQPFVDETGGFAAAIRSLHYAPSLERLHQPALAIALSTGTTIDENERIEATLWESDRPELEGLRVVGGRFCSVTAGLPYVGPAGRFGVSCSKLSWDCIEGFFGIEERIFHRLVATARLGPLHINNLPGFERRTMPESGISFLPDGHVLGPAEGFRRVELLNL